MYLVKAFFAAVFAVIYLVTLANADPKHYHIEEKVN